MTHFIFDCDDVLLDWIGGFTEYVRTQHLIFPDIAGPQSWSLAQWLGVSERNALALVQMFNASQAFGNLKALPHARDVVWGLRDAGHTISVLTACGDGFEVRRARVSNLIEALKGPRDSVYDGTGFDAIDQIDFLPLGASKFDHLYSASRSNADLVFIDDSFRHAQSGVVNGIKTYCLRRSHNRRCEIENPASGVIWIDDIRGVLP